MPDIIDLTQVASANDRVMHNWINAVRNELIDLRSQLALANQTINQLRSETAQAFRVSVVSGLNLSYTAGAVKLTSGLVTTIAPGNITVPNNATSFIFVNDSGAVVTSQSRPTVGLEIARVVTANNQVTTLQNYPLFAVRPTDPDLSQYATVSYADSRTWQSVAVGRKTNLFNIPATDNYYQIPFEALQGAGLNTAGTFTHTGQPRKYIFSTQVRVDTLVPDFPLAIKLSLFVNGVEILLSQGDSAYGDYTTSVQNSEPVTLNDGQQANLRIYLTRGRQARVREGSTVLQIWRLPV